MTDRDGGRGPDVVVPDRIYKRVTVVSTLLAMVLVVLGFFVLDVATNWARAPVDRVNVPLALLGLAVIAAGGLVYAFAARFRAAGMGKDKDGPNGGSDHG